VLVLNVAVERCDCRMDLLGHLSACRGSGGPPAAGC
jgi:hypothetical protein